MSCVGAPWRRGRKVLSQSSRTWLELFHVVEALATAQEGAQRDGETVRQGVIDDGGDARIRHFLQDGQEAGLTNWVLVVVRPAVVVVVCGGLCIPSHLDTLFKSTRSK